MKFKQDTRSVAWSEIENDVQNRAELKDKNFKLNGEWKKYVETRQGFKVYIVNGKWVRNNLSIIFGHGGHGYVHEFIPNDEIWISSHHYIGCDCNLGNEKISKNYFISCVIHEITEHELMKNKNISYWKAHQMALEKERQLGLILNI